MVEETRLFVVAPAAGVNFVDYHEETESQLVNHKNSHPGQVQEVLLEISG